MDNVCTEMCRLCFTNKTALKSMTKTSFNNLFTFSELYELISGFKINCNDTYTKMCAACEALLILIYKFGEQIKENERKIVEMNKNNLDRQSTFKQSSSHNLFSKHYVISSITCDADSCEKDDVTMSTMISKCQFVIAEKSLLKCMSCDNNCEQENFINSLPNDHQHSNLLCMCGKYLKNRKIFLKHFNEFHNETVKSAALKCQFCDESFLTFNMRASHEAHHHGFYKFECDACKKLFYRSDGLKNHKKTCLDNCELNSSKIFNCSLCDLKFIRENSFQKHLLTAHSNIEKDFNVVSVEGKNNDMQETQKDRKKTNKPAECECKICGEKFQYHSTKLSHMARMHKTRKALECTAFDCEYKTLKKDRFLAHLEKHKNPNKTFECPICQEEFKSYNSMTLHRAKHSSPSTVYQCETCSKTFLNKRNFVAHCRLHSGEKLFRCNVCHKGYTRKEHLKYHQVKSQHLDGKEADK